MCALLIYEPLSELANNQLIQPHSPADGKLKYHVHFQKVKDLLPILVIIGTLASSTVSQKMKKKSLASQHFTTHQLLCDKYIHTGNGATTTPYN